MLKLAKYRDFDSFLDALLPDERAICLQLRALIRSEFPEWRETFAYGCPYFRGKHRICFLYPASLPYSGLDQGVSLGFARGHLLSNEQRLLNMGNRKEVGYVVFRTVADIPTGQVLEMLHEANILDQ